MKKLFIVLFLFISAVQLTSAQAPCEDQCAGLSEPELSECIATCEGDVNDVPLNQYVVLLLLAGTFMGIYSINKAKSSLHTQTKF